VSGARRWRYYPIILAGVLASVALAACSRTGPQRSDEPPIGAVPVVRSVADIVLPLDAYLSTPEQRRVIGNAVDLLGRTCMARLGLDWPGSRSTATGNPLPRNERRYSIIDPAKAAVQGYHAPQILQAQQDVEHQPTKLAPAVADAWTGDGPRTYNGRTIPEGGCSGEAMRLLSQGAKQVDPGLAEQLQLDSFARTRNDSRVAHVFATWSACMKKRGYDFGDPFAAVRAQQLQPAQVIKEEIATAVADVDCKRQTNLAGVMLAVETAYQQRMIGEHTTELADLKTLMDTQLAAATRVLAGPS
jgi:hypothetical protein